ncbi:hypothetical protein HK413_03085 [Mucilaginibacter sp. S1162]|uniref:Uncharacterized protein n=1 Tax=Mucilaginibacter humi TaxID=2732510 RepID=A0ABX1VZM3_9SPHI|nr:hypothetical protein [Mucilaginibacter humi]NNU33392.1 hypothetical protein [Mucilaginibacter humi]
MKINKAWHAENVMPKNATPDQRITRTGASAILRLPANAGKIKSHDHRGRYNDQ